MRDGLPIPGCVALTALPFRVRRNLSYAFTVPPWGMRTMTRAMSSWNLHEHGPAGMLGDQPRVEGVVEAGSRIVNVAP